jgi:hypothetical protein
MNEKKAISIPLALVLISPPVIDEIVAAVAKSHPPTLAAVDNPHVELTQQEEEHTPTNSASYTATGRVVFFHGSGHGLESILVPGLPLKK